jgi:hypothetical protein
MSSIIADDYSTMERRLSDASYDFELKEAEDAYSKIFETDEKRERFDKHIKALIAQHGCSILDAYLLEACDIFLLELPTMKLLLKKFYKDTSMHPKVSQVHSSIGGLEDFSDEALPSDVQDLIASVAQSEEAYEIAARAYGQALFNAFGPVQTWTGSDNFKSYRLSFLRKMAFRYLDEKVHERKIPRDIKDKNEILGLLHKPKHVILASYTGDVGHGLYKTREALRKWIGYEDARFMKKATEAVVSALFRSSNEYVQLTYFTYRLSMLRLKNRNIFLKNMWNTKLESIMVLLILLSALQLITVPPIVSGFLNTQSLQ